MERKLNFRRIRHGITKLSPFVTGYRVREGKKLIDSFMTKKAMMKQYPRIKEYVPTPRELRSKE